MKLLGSVRRGEVEERLSPARRRGEMEVKCSSLAGYPLHLDPGIREFSIQTTPSEISSSQNRLDFSTVISIVIWLRVVAITAYFVIALNIYDYHSPHCSTSGKWLIHFLDGQAMGDFPSVIA